MDTIIVGVDRSETARRAAVTAATRAIDSDAHLHIVMCTKRRGPNHVAMAGQRWQLDPLREAQHYLQSLVARLGAPKVSTTVSFDDPASVICTEARRRNADLIVVGNRRMQGPGRFLGAVASDVLRKAPCDVFVANTTAADRS